jgi:hypothetical protein
MREQQEKYLMTQIAIVGSLMRLGTRCQVANEERNPSRAVEVNTWARIVFG